MATDSGGGTTKKKKKRTTTTQGTGYEASLQSKPGISPGLEVYMTNTDQQPFDLSQIPGTATAPGTDPYTTPTANPATNAAGQTANYVGNQFLDNPAAAVNNIMQGLGLSVSSNSPFYNQMQQLAPGLEWMHYFSNGTGAPGQFLGGVGDWFANGTMSPGYTGNTALGGMLGNFLSGGNNAELSAMIDNLTPEDIVRAMASMMETGMYGTAGSRVREGLQARLLDQYNQFVGNQPTIEAGLGAGQTIADAFRDFMNQSNILSQLGF